MAEDNKELSHEDVRNDMYSVMADTLQEMRDSDEETPVLDTPEPEETVNAAAEPEPTQTDTDTPTYQEAENAQQDARGEDDTTKEQTEAVSDSETHETRPQLDEEDADVYGNLKPKAQERFEHWINRAKELEAENQTLEHPKQMYQYVEESSTTGEQLQWAVEMFRSLNSGDYNSAKQALQSIDQFADKIGDALGVNKNNNNDASSFEDFEDLKNAVDNLEINEDWANNLAAERVAVHSQNQAQERFSQVHVEQMQNNQLYEQYKSQAYNEIDAWERGIRESDADYAGKKEIMLDIGREIAASDIPPQNWLSTLEQQYNVLTRGMAAGATGNGRASKKSGPLAPSRTSGGIEPSNTLNTAEVTTDFLKATLDEMRN